MTSRSSGPHRHQEPVRTSVPPTPRRLGAGPYTEAARGTGGPSVLALALPALVVLAAEHGLPGEQLEALVDVVRSTQEADVACVLKGQDDGSWSVSLRSRGATDVAQVAMALGGGGHVAAAGYSSYVDREATIAALRAELCTLSASGLPPRPGAVPDGR